MKTWLIIHFAGETWAWESVTPPEKLCWLQAAQPWGFQCPSAAGHSCLWRGGKTSICWEHILLSWGHTALALCGVSQQHFHLPLFSMLWERFWSAEFFLCEADSIWIKWKLRHTPSVQLLLSSCLWAFKAQGPARHTQRQSLLTVSCKIRMTSVIATVPGT